jgi:hypothetical protein
MNDIFDYLISLSACLAVLYCFFLLFFSHDTFYVRNRIFLLSILILSAAIPLIKVIGFPGSNYVTGSSGVFSDVIVSGNRLDSVVSDKIGKFSFHNLIVIIYLIFSAIFLIRTIHGILSALDIIRNGVLINSEFPKVVLVDSGKKAFSFFPYIVVSRELYNDKHYHDIIEHEKVHVKQFHTFDLLLCELFISLQWFNPFVWLIKRSIVLNHEYLADNVSIVKSQNRKEYQYKLLNLSVQMAAVRLTHNFSSSIKKRLIMINKKPTQNYAAIKGFLVIPVVAILFLFFAFKPETVSSGNSNDEPLFSKSSLAEIYKFLSTNMTYPDEAKSACDTGSVYVLVKMGKGGVLKECKAISDPGSINAPLFDEIVIVGYKPASPGNASGIKDHPQLKAECLRIAQKLPTLNLPEWKDKDMSFVMSFKFTLK